MEKRKDTEKQESTEKRVATTGLFVGQLLSLCVLYGVNFAGRTHLRDHYVYYTTHEATVCINHGDAAASDVTTATIQWEHRHVTVLVTRVNSSYSKSV